MASDETIEKDYMGKISWHRIICGGARPMFGSDIKTDHPISIQISKAYISSNLREYNCDADIFEHSRPYIEVMMTPVQWAEFLTSGNTTGVPCTICSIDGKSMSPVEEKNVASEFDADFKTAFEKTATKLAACEDTICNVLSSGKTMNKTQLNELAKRLKWAREGYLSDIAYIRNRFAEDMESIVAKAKAEVSAYAQAHIGDGKIALSALGAKEIDVSKE